MNYNRSEFQASYGLSSQLPESDRPEFVFSGRSNVGKSSLINRLCNRKNLARVSATPGKTATINFYRVDTAYFVDLPGYGYARASHEERRKWAKLLEHYLADCKTLKALALLLDCRLPPQKLDLELASFARGCCLPLLPVLTKADKCSQRERAARQKEWQELLNVKPVLTSSSSRLGMEELWRALVAAAGTAETDGDAAGESEDGTPTMSS